MKKELRQQLKERIEALEYIPHKHDNGFHVDVRNITVNGDVVCADIILDWQLDGKTERYNGCEYSKRSLLGDATQLPDNSNAERQTPKQKAEYM